MDWSQELTIYGFFVLILTIHLSEPAGGRRCLESTEEKRHVSELW